jgi:cytochrome c biogenesis protein CcmG, thiol:disulfide interchange protein DsbE
VRRRPLRLALVGAAVAAALVIAEVATSGGGGRERPAPALPAEVLVSPRVTLATLHGRPAIVNFWASWCHPCEREAPELLRFASHSPLGARLVGVDFTDDRGMALAFIRKHGWRYPNLRDGDGTVGRRYGVGGLPTTFVVDRQGDIVRTLRGPQTTMTLERAVRSQARQ